MTAISAICSDRFIVSSACPRLRTPARCRWAETSDGRALSASRDKSTSWKSSASWCRHSRRSLPGSGSHGRGGHSILHLVDVHAVGAVGVGDECTLIQEIIELDGHALGVRVLKAEAEGAE